MNFNGQPDFQQLQQTLTAPQYGQANPNLNMSMNKAARAMALQNAMNSLKSGDIGLQGQEQALQNQERMAQLKNQQAGPLDWISSGLGALSALNGSMNKRNMQNGGDSQGLFANIFGGGNSDSGTFGPGF